MFEKLLATLPYNPGLAQQVSFYGRRMREESAIRRTGLIFIVLAFMIQFFAVLSPPEQTSASPNNNMLNYGFSSAGDAAAKCRNNTKNFKEILNHYGITCVDLEGAKTIKLASNSHNGRLYSMGYNSYGQRNPTTGRATNQSPVNIPGAQKAYVRLLDSFGTTSYDALRVTSSTGKAYWLLYNCGNLVSVGVPQPAPPPKDACPNKPGMQNSSSECDVCPNKDGIQTTKAECDVCPNKAGRQLNKDQCDVCSNLPGIQTTKAECDVCPEQSGVQKQQSQCDVCPNKAGVQTSSAECDVCPAVDGVQIAASECDVCPNTGGEQSDADQCDVCPDTEGVQGDSSECTTPCQYDSTLTSVDPNCKPCAGSIDGTDTSACVELSKTASNITAGISDANNTTANPGDTITYTLYARNDGKAPVNGFSFEENMDDVLVYADTTDLHGGTMDDRHNVVWPSVNIAPGQTATVQITIKVKNPIPQTAAGIDDPYHYDLIMTNVYGNTVNISVPGGPGKTVEAAAATLPNTGPGTSLFIGGTIVVIAGYFFGRARLLAKESAVALKESTSGV